MDAIRSLLGREPVLILTAVGAFIALLVAFGFDISTDQKAAIDAGVAALLALVARASVTPVVDPRLDT
jgi:hypothetical protein